jgi:hypothetical protein
MDGQIHPFHGTGERAQIPRESGPKKRARSERIPDPGFWPALGREQNRTTEWSASLNSNNRNNAWIFNGNNGNVNNNNRTNTNAVRCLGR